jgi:hypothetical protein
LFINSSVVGMEHRNELAREQAVFAGMALMQTLAFLDPPPHNALCLGLGAGAAPAFFSALGMVTDVVEHNSEIVSLAQQHFLFGSQQLRARIRNEDAARLVRLGRSGGISSGQQQRQQQQRYDVVLHDLWDGSVHDEFHVGGGPWSTLTLPYFESLKAHELAPRGTLAVNVVSHIAGAHAVVARSVARTLRAAFAHIACLSDDQPPPTHAQARADLADLEVGPPRNVLILASDVPIKFVPAERRVAVPLDDLVEGTSHHVHAFAERWMLPVSLCGGDEIGGDEGSTGFLLRTADDVAALAPSIVAASAGMRAVQQGWLSDEVRLLLARDRELQAGEVQLAAELPADREHTFGV